MPPFGSVPAGTRHDGQHRTGSGINLPASLPRYEGFASTLGGFARSPQVSRGLPSILRPTQELEEPLISEQQRESAFIESLQAPSLTDERTDTADGHAQQSFRPASLLARSLGTLNEVFSRQKIGEAHAAEHGDAASASGALGGSPSAGSRGTTPSMASDKLHIEDIVIGPMPDAREPPTTTKQTRAAQVQAALLCGVINSIITIPVMTSFAAIIFQDHFFQPVLGQMVKLVFLSSGVHQLTFSIKSTLPFAVGQVQDVGLIFLSAMATSIVETCSKAGKDSATTLGTVLLTLLLTTFLVGVLIILTGTLKLASLVQYVPLPVVGGYLGYVGYFCLASGVSLASGVNVDSPQTWLQLLHWDPAMKLAPAVVSTLLLMLVMSRFRSPWALPAVLIFIPGVFFVVLACLHKSLAQAQDGGWVARPQGDENSGPFWEIYSLYNIHDLSFRGIYWAVMPRQIPTALALFFVVAFGSSLDVAAIQQDSPEPLDYNRELVTVGWSNVATSVAGAGFTGSYIFSQTIFTMRAGVNSRINGYIVSLLMLAIFAAPFSVIEYLPSYFFGSLMIWIGWEIARDWLFLAVYRVRGVEYGLLVATFVAIMVMGLELGIAAGIVAASLLFAYNYSKVPVGPNVLVTAFTVVPSRSGAVRTFEQRTVLEQFNPRCVAVSLSGYIFFGSSVKISDKVLEVAKATLSDASVLLDSLIGDDQPNGSSSDTFFEGSVRERFQAAASVSPRFLLLDFRRVQGLDATAARTFHSLRSALERLGVELVLTHLPTTRPHIRQLLMAHGVIVESAVSDAHQDAHAVHQGCRAFDHMEAGLQYCEERFLEVALHYKLCKPRQLHMNLSEVLRAHLELPHAILPGPINYAKAAGELRAFMTVTHLQPGSPLFKQGEHSDVMFIVESGVVTCHMDFLRLHHRMQLPALSQDVLAVAPVRASFEQMAQQAPKLLNLLQTIILRSTCLSVAHALEALERSGMD
ncbi:MAG: Sulfate Permease Family [Trebouxia sp. A1-2]|nr:MAG: Sulfate Permease Family [Trebouxia sp. A1-2]